MAVGLLLASCGDKEQGEFHPNEAVLSSCVIAPNTGPLLPLRLLEGRLVETGHEVAWEAKNDNYILRSRFNDLLTGQQQVVDFDIQYVETGAGDSGAAGCGPGTSTIRRIKTNSGILEGVLVDQFLGSIALVLAAEQPPEAVQAPAQAVAAPAVPSTGPAVGTCHVEGVMAGPCRGLFHEGSVVLGSQEASGCHVELTWTAVGADSKVYGYRNPCVPAGYTEPLEGDVLMCGLTKSGNCWVNENVRVCLNQ